MEKKPHDKKPPTYVWNTGPKTGHFVGGPSESSFKIIILNNNLTYITEQENLCYRCTNKHLII